MVEITITIKGEDSTFKQKFLIYDAFEMNENDPILKKHIELALANSKIDPIDDIKVRALLVVK